MKFVFISDTHNMHEKLDIPDGDVLVHCGDFSGSGSLIDLSKFMKWFEAQPHKYKIFIAGNHDWCFHHDSPLSQKLVPDSITYLEDSEIIIDGLKIYGSPWTPMFYNWAFMLSRGKKLIEKWAKIPDDTDVLITHGPPHEIADQAPDGFKCGCKDLLERVHIVKPQVHAFGHIHGGGRRGYPLHGVHKADGLSTLFINASNCTEDYEIKQKPIVMQITQQTSP